MKKLLCIFSVLVVLSVGSVSVLADPWAEPDTDQINVPAGQEEVLK